MQGPNGQIFRKLESAIKNLQLVQNLKCAGEEVFGLAVTSGGKSPNYWQSWFHDTDF
jgi:hypothetical protein